MRAVQIANLPIREPQQNLIYELRTEQQITRISEPDGNVFWDGKSNYFVLQLDGIPDRGHDVAAHHHVRRRRAPTA